jgi:Periplasmic binding protein
MRLAAAQAGLAVEVVDAGPHPVSALRELVASRPPAVVVLDQPAAVTAARPEIEAARVPVLLVGGDLYSTRSLYRYAFQVSIPVAWQARVLVHYLVSDRGYEVIGVAGPDPGGVFAAALAEEGVSEAETHEADAVLSLGPRQLATVSPDAQPALSSDALAATDGFPPGTVACGPYTWAGWADMIPRVHAFRERFAARYGRDPLGPEQEGYEALRALAEALDRVGGRGGDALVRELESFREETYSSIPIRLGPDDHVLAEQSQLGLFAVAASDEEPAVGEAIGTVPWRALMRTFTTDGERVNLLDRDKRLFFPGWSLREPSPNYWRSRYGIVTRPEEDPLH